MTMCVSHSIPQRSKSATTTSSIVGSSGGEFRARFLRTAYYHLAEHFRTDDGENSRHYGRRPSLPDSNRGRGWREHRASESKAPGLRLSAIIGSWPAA